MTRVDVSSDLLRWARDRSRLEPDVLKKRFPKFEEWESGRVQPTLKQLESFAKASRTPIGFFFLSKPPEEQLPIPDFRTVANVQVAHPSPDLLDTIYLCQQRQDWYRDFQRSMGEEPFPFIGSVGIADKETRVAAEIREALGFNTSERAKFSTWTEALRRFVEQADELGVLVMVSGVVGSNNKRKLDPQEFRGFALADPLAPLVFLNGADSKSAQMFSLAHEIAHLWLGRSGVSDASVRLLPDKEVERWCNQVAAELLVPMEELRRAISPVASISETVKSLTRRFKVSSLVILRRLYDAGILKGSEYRTAFEGELEFLKSLPSSGGGNFYLTTGARVGKRFARALVVSTLEGRTGFTESFRMLGLKKLSTFEELGQRLGVIS